MPQPPNLPRVIANGFPQPSGDTLLRGKVDLLPWSLTQTGDTSVTGLYMVGHDRMDGPIMDRLPNLRVISSCSVGVDHIDVKSAQQRGIKVGHTPGVLDACVADCAMGLLIMAARRFGQGLRLARDPKWTTLDHNYLLGREVHGATLGILGMGNIGRQIARRAAAFDMPILYHNRTRRPEAEATIGAQYVSFDELLAESDFLVLMVPLTPKTRGIINAAALAKMKPTATLINMARGPVVDTAALAEAMLAQRLYHAALDVTDPEPLPRDHPLLTLDNVTITPHLGSATVQTRIKMAEISAENLLRGVRGEPLVHEAKP
jgi:glyoxylate reductase